MDDDFYLTADSMKNMDPEELAEALMEEYVFEIPNEVPQTPEDLMAAGKVMAKLANDYAYLICVLNSFKIWTKYAKECCVKEDADKMQLRKDTVASVVDSIDYRYKALSRLVACKQEANRELMMTGGM